MGIIWNGHYLEGARRLWITREDFRTIFSVATPEEKVILALGAGMGLRRGEIAGCNIDRIGNGTLSVNGKGHNAGKVVELAIPKLVMDIIDDYLPIRAEILSRHGDHSDGNLLVRDRVHAGYPVSSNHVSNTIVKLRERSGVDFTCHSLRRLFAMIALDNSDIVTTKFLMRHSSFETTLKCYIEADPNRKKTTLNNVGDILLGEDMRDGVDLES